MSAIMPFVQLDYSIMPKSRSQALLLRLRVEAVILFIFREEKASDKAQLANIIDPAIGCTPFLNPSLDDPGAKVPSPAGDELQ
jgi:hypothetical protein